MKILEKRKIVPQFLHELCLKIKNDQRFLAYHYLKNQIYRSWREEDIEFNL
jgi:hypothetical protein